MVRLFFIGSFHNCSFTTRASDRSIKNVSTKHLKKISMKSEGSFEVRQMSEWAIYGRPGALIIFP